MLAWIRRTTSWPLVAPEHVLGERLGDLVLRVAMWREHGVYRRQGRHARHSTVAFRRFLTGQNVTDRVGTCRREFAGIARGETCSAGTRVSQMVWFVLFGGTRKGGIRPVDPQETPASPGPTDRAAGAAGLRAGRATARALALACHPLPTVAVTAISAGLAALAGLASARGLLLVVAILAGQLSIGWSNDASTRARDGRASAGGQAGRHAVPSRRGRSGSRPFSALLAVLVIARWPWAGSRVLASIVVARAAGPTTSG